MALHFVRHAKAGHREGWNGDDRERPLTAKGWEQARALAKVLATEPTGRLLSSPYTRCMQTLQPLAEGQGRDVEATQALAEGEPVEAVIGLLDALPDGSVLCTHGDLFPAVIEELERRGMAVHGEPDWRKGARWELTRDGDHIAAGHPHAPVT